MVLCDMDQDADCNRPLWRASNHGAEYGGNNGGTLRLDARAPNLALFANTERGLQIWDAGVLAGRPQEEGASFYAMVQGDGNVVIMDGVSAGAIADMQRDMERGVGKVYWSLGTSQTLAPTPAPTPPTPAPTPSPTSSPTPAPPTPSPTPLPCDPACIGGTYSASGCYVPPPPTPPPPTRRLGAALLIGTEASLLQRRRLHGQVARGTALRRALTGKAPNPAFAVLILGA